MEYCPSCGERVEDSRNTCPKCDHNLGKPRVLRKEDSNAETGSGSSTTHSTNKEIKIISIVALAVLVAPVTVYELGDWDSDGLPTYKEQAGIPFDIGGLDPMDADTDSDGLSDGKEVKVYRSSPHLADTDRDGILDGKEVKHYGSDPVDPDTNGNGINDSRMVELGLYPAQEYPGLKHVESTEPKFSEDFVDTFYEGERTAAEDTFLDAYITAADRDQSILPALNDRFLGDGKANETDAERMKFIADLPDEWFDVAVEHGAPPDLDRDGLMNWDDPDPLKPTNKDNDPLLDGWYNKDMDRDFDPVFEKHGDATLEGASPDRADIPVYVYWMEKEYPNGTHISSKPDQADYDALEDIYEDAPIENPDGTTGYNVIFLDRGTLDYEKKAYKGDTSEAFRRPHRHTGIGYTAVFVPWLNDDGSEHNIVGKTLAFNTEGIYGGAVVEDVGYESDPDKEGTVAAHEFGHLAKVQHEDMGVHGKLFGEDAWEMIIAHLGNPPYYESPVDESD